MIASIVPDRVAARGRGAAPRGSAARRPAFAQTPQPRAAARPKPRRSRSCSSRSFPARQSRGVAKTPYFGLYEVQLDDQIVYTDAKATYVDRRLDLRYRHQEEPDRGAAAQAEHASRCDSLPLDLAFKRVKGNGERKLVDLLRRRLPVLRAARAGAEEHRQRHDLHVPVPDRPAASGCRAQVADDLVLAGQGRRRGTSSSRPARCPTTRATATIRSPRPARSAASCKINATPTLVFADGSIVPGALPARSSKPEIDEGARPKLQEAADGEEVTPRVARSHAAIRERGAAMAIIDFLKKQFIDIIEWTDDSRDTLSFRFPDEDKEIKNGAQLIVRESQVAQFVYLGQFGDTFGPGKHTLTTDNIPILTNLKGWKYALESPFKADVYYVVTRLFTGNKWGTANPVMMRDADFGIVRLRAYGTYDFRVVDVKKFLKEVAGTDDHFRLDEFADTMRSRIVSVFTDALASGEDPGARRRVALRRAGRGAAAADQSRRSATSTASR